MSLISETNTPKPNRFTAHPASVGESYWQHAAFAMRFSVRLFAAAGAAAVHAVFPWMCETTASQRIKVMAAELEARHKA